ncbi:transposable element Tcb1 transposase [Trichonephila clavipes]|nr:transposable element Tcb1 transposase [Trichonephila clavipes]
MVWDGIGFHCRISPVRIAGTLDSQRFTSEVLEPVVLPYIQRLLSAMLQQDNASISNRKCVIHACTMTDPGYITHCYARSTLVVYGSCTDCYIFQGYIQSLCHTMPRRVASVIANNGGYTNY